MVDDGVVRDFDVAVDRYISRRESNFYYRRLGADKFFSIDVVTLEFVRQKHLLGEPDHVAAGHCCWYVDGCDGWFWNSKQDKLYLFGRLIGCVGDFYHAFKVFGRVDVETVEIGVVFDKMLGALRSAVEVEGLWHREVPRGDMVGEQEDFALHALFERVVDAVRVAEDFIGRCGLYRCEA